MKEISKRAKIAAFFDSHIMHWIIGTLVSINAVILGLETLTPFGEQPTLILQVIDNIILWIFVIEICTRIIVIGPTYFLHPWNWFDCVIVFASFIPTETTHSVFKALRVMRMFYFVQIAPKMKHILRGVFHSLPGLVNVVILLLIVFYVASIMGVFLFKHPNLEAFHTLPAAMQTLFQIITGDDWSSIFRSVKSIYPYSWIYFYSFYITMVFIILNLFIGVVVNALQEAEEELNPSKGEDILNSIQEELKKIRNELTSIKESLKK